MKAGLWHRLMLAVQGAKAQLFLDGVEAFSAENRQFLDKNSPEAQKAAADEKQRSEAEAKAKAEKQKAEAEEKRAREAKKASKKLEKPRPGAWGCVVCTFLKYARAVCAPL